MTLLTLKMVSKNKAKDVKERKNLEQCENIHIYTEWKFLFLLLALLVGKSFKVNADLIWHSSTKQIRPPSLCHCNTWLGWS